MKKRLSIAIFFAILISLAVMAVGVQASADPTTLAKPHPTNEPGAVATQRADERAQDEHTQQQGNGQSEVKNSDKEEKDQGKGNAKESPAGTEEPDAKQPKNLHFRGFVTEVGLTSLTISLKDGGEPVTFTVTGDTQVKIPTLWQCSTCSDLVPGVQVLVKAVQNESGQLVAVTVHVVPGKPTKQHRVGEVVVYQPGVRITILAKDGQEYTFFIDQTTKILPLESAEQLGPGAQVTIICPRDVTGQPAIAKGIVVHALSDAGESGDDSQPEPTE
jgi:hypothetical protein